MNVSGRSETNSLFSLFYATLFGLAGTTIYFSGENGSTCQPEEVERVVRTFDKDRDGVLSQFEIISGREQSLNTLQVLWHLQQQKHGNSH